MSKKEKLLTAAQEHLKGETIKHVIEGTYETKLLKSENIKSGIFIATNTRIVFYAKKLFGYEMEDFPYSNISSMEHGKKGSGRYITFFASGNKVHMKWIPQDGFDNFLNFVKSNIGKKGSAAPVAKESSSDEIRKFKELLDDGIITEEEFDAKKKQLLGI